MRRIGIISVSLVLFAAKGLAAQGAAPNLPDGFQHTLQPFVQTYCAGCHNKQRHKGDFDLSPYTSSDLIAKDEKRWALVLDKLKSGDMPPEEAKKHPSPESRREVIDWIVAVRNAEAQRNAGDPGTVLAHRLSNAEYNYTIRDLTGVDIQPTKEFPIDPANQAGFDNSGESLAMSPSLLKKYMEAARKVSEYLVFKPDGLDFAPYPMVSETDRDKYCVNRIIDFYKHEPTDLADYFLAAWRFENRARLGMPQARLEDFAAEQKVSPKYLRSVYSALTDQSETIGPVAALQVMWKSLPAPPGDQRDALQQGCRQMRDWVVAIRQKVRPEFSNLTVGMRRRGFGGGGMHPGSQPLVLWKDRQFADTRLTYAPGSALKLTADDFSAAGETAATLLHIPDEKAARDRYEESFKHFCSIFPDAFLVTERARIYLNDKSEEKLMKGRFLSAGFHSQMGYFRDDEPLYQLILNSKDQQELDKLWRELDFIADAPRRTLQGMIWFERSDSSFMRSQDFDFVRAEERDIVSEPKLKKLEDAFVAKVKTITTDPVGIGAVTDYFESMNTVSRWLDQARLAAEPIHVAALQDFAQRAYRRPLSPGERQDIAAFYHSLRAEDHLEHEDAIRDTMVSILMSPYFCYRVNLTPPDGGVHPLSDYELASRLSYFLWSSMPDQRLLDHAAAGDLHRPEILLAEAPRMMRDDRVRDFATEFAGNWLDFRRFEDHNAVDRERFPSFNNDLREAMFQEPIRFFVDVVQNDRSVLDFLYGDYTFVNPDLARHYGMPVPDVKKDQWVRIDDAHQYQRGGLLPMAVFLTKNAPGLRTSPVKRGYWVVKRVLGEEIPPPPPNVPVLPNDESKLGDLTLPQMLAQHRSDKNCATCHEHFDSVGLSFEGFGPIGELRTLDLGGKPVQNHPVFRDGREGTGLDGLRRYLRESRQDDFLDNLSRKLLAEALGRTLMLSDEPLIQQMHARLQSNGYRFSNLVECIVTSPQFLNKRGQSALAKRDG